MIVEVEGDILLSKAEVIAHSVAPNDDFHSGLALALRENWPAMYKDFRHYCRLDHPKTGSVWAWKGMGGPWIYALLTQEAAYGQGSKPGVATVEAVGHALELFAEECVKNKFKTIAIGKIATGVGALKWQEVEPLIKRHLGKLQGKVYLYSTFKKGSKAEEN